MSYSRDVPLTESKRGLQAEYNITVISHIFIHQ